MRKFWAHKRHAESQVVTQRQQLRQMDRAIHLLQRCLDDRECNVLELHKHWKASVELIARAHKPAPGNTAGTANGTFGVGRANGAIGGGQHGHPEEGNDLRQQTTLGRIRDQLIREFFHSLHTQLSPARLCPWLHIADDLGIHLCFSWVFHCFY